MPDQMTRRDTVAAMAMQAAATNPKGADGFTFEQRATWAYMQADAMETARNPTPTNIHPDTARLDWMLAMLGDQTRRTRYSAKRHPL